jgi:hypothetical protein
MGECIVGYLDYVLNFYDGEVVNYDSKEGFDN